MRSLCFALVFALTFMFAAQATPAAEQAGGDAVITVTAEMPVLAPVVIDINQPYYGPYPVAQTVMVPLVTEAESGILMPIIEITADDPGGALYQNKCLYTYLNFDPFIKKDTGNSLYLPWRRVPDYNRLL